MVEQDQARPLSPERSDHQEAAIHLKKIRRKRRIKCCGCITALLLVPATVIVILIFTVFRVKDPTIELNKVTIIHRELINNTIPKPGTNISLIADVSVTNPSMASFRYDNATSSLYYHGVLVGEARGPPGHSKARKTMRLNATVDLVTEKLLSTPQLTSDLGVGLLTLDSFAKIPGRMKIWIIKKHVTVKMDCSITFNFTSQGIQKQKCKSKVDL